MKFVRSERGMVARGRPREFDEETALDAAVDVFWRQGYEGTTLDDLTLAMGISKPSLYGAFGDKARTFERALERYVAVEMAYVEDAIAEPTARAVATHYLHSNVLAVTTPGKPRGCLSIQGAVAAKPSDQRIVDLLSASRRAGEERLAQRLARAAASGDLAEGEDPSQVAKFLSTVSAGLAVQAVGGTSAEDLTMVADRALGALALA
jgi:AcrR family transcriptional regulator